MQQTKMQYLSKRLWSMALVVYALVCMLTLGEDGIRVYMVKVTSYGIAPDKPNCLIINYEGGLFVCACKDVDDCLMDRGTLRAPPSEVGLLDIWMARRLGFMVQNGFMIAGLKSICTLFRYFSNLLS